MNQRKTSDVCFVVHKRHMVSLFEHLSNSFDLVSIGASRAPKLSEERFMRIWRTPVHAFGLHSIMQFFRRETQAPLYVGALGSFLKREKPAVVIVFDVYHWYTLQCIAHKRRHPETKLILYSETRHWPRNLLSRILLRFFMEHLKKHVACIDTIFVYTHEGRAFFADFLPERPAVVVPAAVDTAMFYPDANNTIKSSDSLRILMNARFIELKRHKDLLAALRMLKDKGIRCTLSFVGNGGHLKEDIAAQVSALGLSDDVTFLSAVPLSQMRSYYVTHDVLVLPSRSEAIGMVVPEAMACGLATVTSDSVGANIYVDEGKTGLIYPAGDVDALARCLEALVDPVVRKEYGSAASERIKKYFSVEAVSDQVAAAVADSGR